MVARVANEPSNCLMCAFEEAESSAYKELAAELQVPGRALPDVLKDIDQLNAAASISYSRWQ